MLATDAKQAIEDLIRELEAASTGGTALDQQIEHCLGSCLGVKANLTEILVTEGVSWPTITEALRDRVPRYTTSLDAALVGENILFVVRSEARGNWAAVQRVFGGREVLAWASTEPLARRIAALKAHALALERSNPPLRTRVSPAAEEPSAQSEPAGEEIQWKVRF